MAWTSLSTRLGSLPLILAGPMLRKVTTDSVTIWLALKEQRRVTLDLVNADRTPVADFSGTAETVAVGPNLHIVAVTARRGGATALEPDRVYFYDLAFADRSGGTTTLTQAVGSRGTQVFAYGTHALPGFSLPPDDINRVRLILGSCRKPHASGPDALAILDDWIESSFDDPGRRPHQLFLNGDQIYADDVQESLLLMISDAARTLLGRGEPAPTAKGVSFVERVLPAMRTQLAAEAGLTSKDVRSHLFSFGEYLAMYLFVWSDVLWPPALTGPPTYADLLAAARSELEPTEPIEKLAKDIDTKRARLVTFADALPKVRRALANVPTYMIFDDHDVTDDWNMTRHFCEQVYGNALGARLVRNGLLAYALCQHWGNAPEQFALPPAPIASTPAGVQLLGLFLAGIAPTTEADQSDFDRQAAPLLGLHTLAQMTAETPFAVYHDVGTRQRTPDGMVDDRSLLFHYTVEAAAYQVIVTDTRTWRSFPRPGKLTVPDLIASSQFAVQIGSTPELAGRVLMVVFPTNFPPIASIRQAQRDIPSISTSLIEEKDTHDAWELQRVGFARALAALSRKYEPNAQNTHAGALVVLSGDLHASFASSLHYRAQAQTDDARSAGTKADLVIVQCVVSALHNQDNDTIGLHKRGYGFVPSWYLQPAAQPVQLQEDLIGWNPGGTPHGTVVGEKRFVTFQSRTTIPALFDSDVPIDTLRTESILNQTFITLTRVDVPPDFRLHLEYRKGSREGQYSQEPPVVPATGLQLFNDSHVAYERYVKLKQSGQYIVGMNNIAEVGFTFGTSSIPVKQVHLTVHWHDEGANRLVRYDVPFVAAEDFTPYPGE